MSNQHLVCCALDVNTAATAGERTFNTNQSITVDFIGCSRIRLRCMQNIAQFRVIALMCIVPNWIAHNINLCIINKNGLGKVENFEVSLNSFLPDECQYIREYSPTHR